MGKSGKVTVDLGALRERIIAGPDADPMVDFAGVLDLFKEAVASAAVQDADETLNEAGVPKRGEESVPDSLVRRIALLVSQRDAGIGEFKPTHRHFKGGLYQVICVAHDSEIRRDIVVYRDEAGYVWSNPDLSFAGEIEVGQELKRFSRILNPEGRAPDVVIEKISEWHAAGAKSIAIHAGHNIAAWSKDKPRYEGFFVNGWQYFHIDHPSELAVSLVARYFESTKKEGSHADKDLV